MRKTDEEELGEKERRKRERKGGREGETRRVDLRKRRGEVKDAGGGTGLGNVGKRRSCRTQIDF